MAQVTLGIVDVSPASIDRALPSIVAQTVQCAPEPWLRRTPGSLAAGASLRAHVAAPAIERQACMPGRIRGL